jgi:hypothetical protein
MLLVGVHNCGCDVRMLFVLDAVGFLVMCVADLSIHAGPRVLFDVEVVGGSTCYVL